MEDLLFRRNLQLQYHIPFGTELEITHFNILLNTMIIQRNVIQK